MRSSGAVALATVAIAGCGDNLAVTMQLRLAGGRAIVDGLHAGSIAGHGLVDGWSIEYERYLVAFAGFHAAQSDAGDELAIDRGVIMELVTASEDGRVIASESAGAGTWDVAGYRIAPPTADTRDDASVTATERATMIEAGLSQWIAGVATRDALRIDFEFRIGGTAAFDMCRDAADDPGFVVDGERLTTVTLTIEGDRFWYQGFVGAVPGSIELRAGWLELADSDADGVVGPPELAAAPAAALFPSPPYDLVDGAPTPITTGETWVQAQGDTVGGFQAGGRCAWSVEAP
jgi:hypothetical protein